MKDSGRRLRSPFEEVDARGRENPVDDQRSQSGRKRESLEGVLDREPRGRDVHAMEGAWIQSPAQRVSIEEGHGRSSWLRN